MSSRRSIVKDCVKSSEEIILELDNIFDKNERHEKKREWQTAICEELKILDENQENLEKRYQATIFEVKNLERIQNNMQGDMLTQFQEVLDEVNTLKKRVEILEKENDGLMKRNTEMQHELDELHIQKGNSHAAGQIIRYEIQPNSRIEIPKFSGAEGERPMRYLKEIKSYMENARADFKNAKHFITQSLQDAAREWWELVEQETGDFKTFEENFKERFWNNSMRRNAKRKLELGRYAPEGRFTRVEYATYLLSIANELELDCPEEEIIEKISEHFGREIRHTILGQQVKDKRNLFKILNDYDADTINEKRKEAWKMKKPMYTGNAAQQQNKNYQKGNTYENRNVWTQKTENEETTHKSKKYAEIDKKTQEKNKKHMRTALKAYENVNNIEVQEDEERLINKPGNAH